MSPPPRPTPVLSRRRPAVLLGLAPAESGVGPWDAATDSARRLGRLAGVSPGDLRMRFGLDNLLPYAEPTRAALRGAGQLYRFAPQFWYVLAGTEVVRALGRRALPSRRGASIPPFLEWYETVEGVVAAVLPHPSGRNHWYNDAGNRRRAARFLAGAAAPPGSRVDARFRAAIARAR